MKPRHGWADALSGHDAAARLARDGYNELPSAQPRSVVSIAWEVLREPMFLLLIGASAIYFLLGDLREASVLFASVFVVVGISFYQERKSERALEALRDLSSPRALVVRDGEARRIPGREVVRDDILLLKEGDRVPADAVLIHCNNLSADESLLTGESVPVRKRAGASGGVRPAPGGDDLPFVYSGTLVTQGQGSARVIAVGRQTEIGRIGKALEGLQLESSPLQQETRRAVLLFSFIGFTLCIAVVVLYGLTRGNWLNGILAGITLAMANLPEEFPLVLTVFLALGAWRISRQDVLTRRAPAIETLGAATVLCVDKTGTLTENRMAVRTLWIENESIDIDTANGVALPTRFHDVVAFSILASEIEPFDPMEKAFLDLGRTRLIEPPHRRRGWQLVHEYPFASEFPAHTHVWQVVDQDNYIVAVKGAPEAVATLCGLTGSARTTILAQVATMAQRGLRVLGVARAELPPVIGRSAPWPASQRDIAFTLIGLVGLEDPVRATVPDAIRECYRAGIRIVMITGDYPGTAQAIARQIGLAPVDQVITGAELAGLGDAALAERIRSVNIFARVVPEQKLRLVQALKANGEIVAMTGDGVNDAPALKAAHIGVAMGGRGTDVAREAASLVLLKDDFTSLVHAVRLGRRIFDNIQKAMSYIVAVHVPIAGLSLLPLLFGWPLVFFPVHIVFLEFVIDPACSIVFEAEHSEADTMRRPPRKTNVRLFNGWMIGATVLQGLGAFVAAAALYGWALAHGTEEGAARAMAFTTVVLGNLGLILTSRARHATLKDAMGGGNPSLWWVIVGTLTALLIVLSIEPVRNVFRFATLTTWQLLAGLGAAVAAFVWFQVCKYFSGRMAAA